MSQLTNIILLAIAGIATIYILYRKLRSHKKAGHVPVKDPKSQELYNKKKNKEERQSLTLQEKIELSWQFLTHITEQIMTKFSDDDKEKVYAAGHKLYTHGMKYAHDVELEVKINQDISKTQTVSISKEKEVEQATGRER